MRITQPHQLVVIPLESLSVEDGLNGWDVHTTSRPGLDEDGHAAQEVHLIECGQVAGWGKLNRSGDGYGIGMVALMIRK